MEQKTVFISYRRALSKYLARSIYQDLKANGWDVFLDVNSIDSGDFDRIILNQIGARAHFILLISPGSLERCANPDDWVLREIQEAVRLERNIVPLIDDDADFSREIGYLPSELREVISKKNSVRLLHDYFEEGLQRVRNRFLKIPEYIQITEVSPTEYAEVQRRMVVVEAEATVLFKPTPTRPTSQSLMPAPFAWVEIPKKGYSIAKYPITNAQFAVFKDDGGYLNREWWSQSGWQEKVTQNWKAPRYWHDSKWNQPTHPVVGVSWYEAVAFSRWLSRKFDERIELPTEDEWQYAAQGNDKRQYPWGTEWNVDRCNSSSGLAKWGQTSSVTQYENIGNSPFGVVDMLGNVWEWCMDWNESKKPLRGGCWRSYTLQIDKRTKRKAMLSFTMWGFRLAKHYL